MSFEEKIFIAVISAMLGAILGVFVKGFLARVGFRHKIVENIVTRYLNARDLICEILAECSIYGDDFKLTTEWLDNKRYDISKLYYQYYDYIPTKVIHALVCFQACIKNKNNRFYCVRENKLAT